jgi:catalase
VQRERPVCWPIFSSDGLDEDIPMAFVRLAVPGAVVAGIVSFFAWAGSELGPGPVNETRLVSALEAHSGSPPGFRRNHAKGVCLTGWFDGNGAGVRLSQAEVFESGRVPVIGRFSIPGGRPAKSDASSPVRSMALEFALPNGEVWRVAMNDTPVFPVRDAEGFYDNLVALKHDPATGKPDPARINAFLDAHPESARALALIRDHPVSSGFADSTYNSLNAFQLIDAAGKATPVRWSLVAVDAFEPQPELRPDGRDYLFDALIARLQRGPIQWRLRLVIGQPGDPTNDATLPWPADREAIEAGTLTVAALESEAEGNCRDVNFDPLMLPRGIAPSDDPLLQARSAVYALSHSRREQEIKQPSAVQVK